MPLSFVEGLFIMAYWKQLCLLCQFSHQELLFISPHFESGSKPQLLWPIAWPGSSGGPALFLVLRWWSRFSLGVELWAFVWEGQLPSGDSVWKRRRRKALKPLCRHDILLKTILAFQPVKLQVEIKHAPGGTGRCPVPCSCVIGRHK